MADLQLLHFGRIRSTLTGHSALGVDPVAVGDWITQDNVDGRWRVTEIEHLHGAYQFSAIKAIGTEPGTLSAVDPGRNVGSRDVFVGQTELIIADLPVLDGVDPRKPLIVIAAAGTTTGWRRAALSAQQGASLLEIGRTASPAIMGSVINNLGPHSPYLVDDTNFIDVQMLHAEMQLPPGNGNALSGGNPLCLVADEIIKYSTAQYIGQNRYRLSGLMRGCFGTETSISSHQSGDRFLLLEKESLRDIDPSSAAIGQTITIEALGLGDDSAVSKSLQVDGRAIKPLAPVHLAGFLQADGGIYLNWIPRARIDFGWIDGIDHPLIEQTEAYHIEMTVNGISSAVWDTASPLLSIPAPTVTSWSLPQGAALEFAVQQIGSFAKSAATIFTMTSA